MGVNVIAELGQTMRGDVGLAVEMVHEFAEAGATHIKVQMLDPEQIATADAVSYWQTGPLVGQRASFTASGVIPHCGWDRVRAACDVANVGFVATPFDLTAVDHLSELAPAAVKVASGDITFVPLLQRIAERMPFTPVLLSTGASTWAELSDAYHSLKPCNVVPFACSLEYPCPIEHANLGRIHHLHTFDCYEDAFDECGYSDHTTALSTASSAVLAGATWLEKHVTPNPGDDVVPDDKMGLNAMEFHAYVAFTQDAERILGIGDLSPTVAEMAARRGARRAARWVNDWDGARRARPDDFTFLRDDPDLDGRSIRVAVRVLADGSAATRPHLAGDIVSADDFR